MRARLRATWSFGRDVQRRFGAAQGSNLAASIACRGYLALFAILVLAVALAGFLNASGRDVADWIIRTLGLTGSAATTVTDAVERAQSSRAATTVVGLLGLLWTGTGLAAAISYAWNAAWSIPGGGMQGRARGVLWLLASGLFATIAVAATSLITTEQLHWSLAFLIGLASDLVLMLITATLLPARRIPMRSILPGAAVAALGLSVVRLVGAELMARLIVNSSSIYGSVGTFFALIVWMLIIGYILVIAAFVEVAAWTRTYGTVQRTIDVPAPR